jgi:hypothetical protein
LTATILASSALALSFISIWISGRREQRKFLRDTNLAVLIDFMQASFNGSIQLTWKQRNSAAPDPEYFAKLKEQWEAAASEKLLALTKLRLTASRKVIAAAYALQAYEQEFHTIVFDESKPNIDYDEYNIRKEEQNKKREALIVAARTSLRVSKSHPIGHTRGIAGIVNRPARDSGASTSHQGRLTGVPRPT